MRVRRIAASTAAAAALTAAALLGSAGTAGADEHDDDSNVVINKETYAPGPGLLGGHNWGNGNWNSSSAFGPMIMD